MGCFRARGEWDWGGLVGWRVGPVEDGDGGAGIHDEITVLKNVSKFLPMMNIPPVPCIHSS